MNALPVEQLLAPLGDDAPCGSDLEYDPAFLALEEVSRGKPEQQFGDTVIPAEQPDWRAVGEQSRALAERTRDLRIAVLVTRSGARLQGITGYAEGLSLIAGLLERYWPQVYPLLDADDNDDPTMRVNALSALAAGDAGLADLRAAFVGNGRNGFNVRQLELAGGRVQPGPNEAAPSEEGVRQALAQAEVQVPGTLAALKSSNADLLRIEAVLNEKVGSLGPDLRPLQVLTRQLLQAATQAEGSAEGSTGDDTSPEGETGTAGGGGSAPVAGAGALRSREDVVRTLDRLCEWLEKNEPTNPAPLLLRRAQRLMGKSFMDIIRDLAPEGLTQIENIAGPSE